MMFQKDKLTLKLLRILQKQCLFVSLEFLEMNLGQRYRLRVSSDWYNLKP